MDAQDFRSLQEAYMEVVENQQLDEGLKKYPWGAVVKQIRRKEKSNPKSSEELQRRHERLRDLTSNELGKPKYRLQDSEKTKKEQVDIYDIILSHLLDEGYAETPEAAEAIIESMSEEWKESIVEATAMAKRGYDEAPIRQEIAKSTGGGEAADRATKLANKPTYGQSGVNPQARQRLARSQRGDFRNTTSSNPGLHGYAHQSNDPEVKAKQAARGAQRGALTPAEKKQLGR